MRDGAQCLSILTLIERDLLRLGVLHMANPAVREGVPLNLELAEDCLKFLDATGLLGPRTC
eukprot:7831720-Alexandrium_andersonii.AAC.1